MAWKFHNGKEISKQIADKIAVAVLTGAIIPGQRLPEISEMSKITGTSANTVVSAYNELIREQIVQNRDGILIINSELSYAIKRRDKIAQECCEKLINELSGIGLSPKEQLTMFGNLVVTKSKQSSDE